MGVTVHPLPTLRSNSKSNMAGRTNDYELVMLKRRLQCRLSGYRSQALFNARKSFLSGIFFQTSLNLFICDMRKWKKNKNIRRRVLFLSNLESISQFGKIIVHILNHYWYWDRCVCFYSSLDISGDCRQWTTLKTGRKVFQLSSKVVFHPLRNLILKKETKYNLERSQVTAPYLLQTF